MNPHTNRGPKLADEESALDLYLDALLVDEGDVNEAGDEPGTGKALRSARGVRYDLDLEDDFDELPTLSEAAELNAFPERESSASAEVRRTAATDSVSRPKPLEPMPKTLDTESEEPVCPITAPVPCLILQRSGCAIAVRVTDIDVVVEWAGQVSPTLHALEGYCGTIPYAGKQAAIVDIDAPLFRPQAVPSRSTAADYKGTRLVIAGGGRIAFVCDEIGQMLTVRPDDVVWANRASRTPWNEGTLKRNLSMLINMQALVDLYCVPSVMEDL